MTSASSIKFNSDAIELPQSLKVRLHSKHGCILVSLAHKIYTCDAGEVRFHCLWGYSAQRYRKRNQLTLEISWCLWSQLLELELTCLSFCVVLGHATLSSVCVDFYHSVYPLSLFVFHEEQDPDHHASQNALNHHHRSTNPGGHRPDHHIARTKRPRKANTEHLTLQTLWPQQSSRNTAWWSLWMDCFCHAHVFIPQFFNYGQADLQLFICFQNGPQCGCCNHNPGLGWVFLRWSVNLYSSSFCFVNGFICFPLVLNPVFK